MPWLNNDAWQYTEESADIEDVLALFDLLALPTVVGIELDHD